MNKELIRLLVLLIACCLQPSLAIASEDISLQKVDFGNNNTSTYITVSLTNFDVRVLSPGVSLSGTKTYQQAPNPERSATGLSLADYQKMSGATGVISGGYLSSFSPPTPLGLVKSNGVLVSRPHDSWLVEGLYCENGSEAVIVKWQEENDLSSFRDCLQAGPILLLGGKQPQDVPSVESTGYKKLAYSVQEQAFLCTLIGKRVALGITSETNLPALVDFLRDKVGCIDAIRLTGKETAGLRYKDKLYGKDQFLFPSAIGIVPR